MPRRRVALALFVAVLVSAAAASAVPAGTRASGVTTQELTITASDGTKLACGLVLPAGSPPAGGWPGLLLFPGFTLSPHASMEDLAMQTFAPAGFASLSCDARGTGASGGTFDLAGPNDVKDVHDLFDWLVARSDVSDTEIGALGFSAGGAEVWNAAVAGVPFKAIVPGLTWTSLSRALTPNGVVKSGLLSILGSSWAPAAVRSDLTGGRVTAAVKHALADRSSLGRLHSLTVPTLMIQGRHDSLYDLDQTTTAYKLLAGPKRLFVGDPARGMTEVVSWFKAYLAGGPKLGGGVELTHAPWDGTTTSFRSLPPTRRVFVNLAGKKNVTSGVLRRSVRVPGGPLETFGDGTITVRYSGASPAWKQIAALVLQKGGSEPVTQGAAPVTVSAGVVKIPLMNTAVLLAQGKRLIVKLGPLEGLFSGTAAPPPATRAITIERVTLNLSVLKRAVSR